MLLLVRKKKQSSMDERDDEVLLFLQREVAQQRLVGESRELGDILVS